MYGIDASGEYVDASGLIWEEGDADRPCRIDWRPLAPVPWRQGGAPALVGLAEHDGQPFFGDPRAFLAKAAERFAALDLCPVVALVVDLGAEFCRLYRVFREAEQNRFADLITPTEYAWYLTTV